MQLLWTNRWNLVRLESVKRLKRIAAFVLPPALTVFTVGLLIRRFPMTLTLASVVPVVVTVIAVIVVTVAVVLRRE